jgi:hypothetical protein
MKNLTDGQKRLVTLGSQIELLTHRISERAKPYTGLSRLFRRNWPYGYAFSIAVGFWLLKGFTKHAEIPFPQPDTVFLAFLALLGLACYLALALLASLPLAALAAVFINPELQRMIPYEGSPLWRASIYFRRYSLIFGPSMAGSASFPGLLVLALYFTPHLGMAWLGFLSIPGSIIAVVIALCLTRYLYSKSKDQFLHRDDDRASPLSFTEVAILSSLLRSRQVGRHTKAYESRDYRDWFRGINDQ